MEIVTVGEVLPSWGQARVHTIIRHGDFCELLCIEPSDSEQVKYKGSRLQLSKTLTSSGSTCTRSATGTESKMPCDNWHLLPLHTLQFLYHHIMERSSVVSCTEARISNLASSQAHLKNWRKGPGIHCSSMQLISVQGSHEIVQGCVKWRPVTWLWL